VQPDPSRGARRSASSQGLLIVLALGIGVLGAMRFYAPRPVRLTVNRMQLLAGEPTLAAVSFRIENMRGAPITLNEIALAVIAADGTRTTAAQLGRDEIASRERFDPALASAMVNPIFRNTQVAAGRTVEAMAVFVVKGPRSNWNARRKATLTVDFNHREAVTAAIVSSR
jgi:hypothetical protein